MTPEERTEIREAVAENEAKWKKMCGGKNCMGSRMENQTNWVTEEARDKAVADERETCARVAEDIDPALDSSQVPRQISSAIRKRNDGGRLIHRRITS